MNQFSSLKKRRKNLESSVPGGHVFIIVEFVTGLKKQTYPRAQVAHLLAETGLNVPGRQDEQRELLNLFENCPWRQAEQLYPVIQCPEGQIVSLPILEQLRATSKTTFK